MNDRSLREVEDELKQFQELYDEWCTLRTKLSDACDTWQRANETMQRLSHFYFEGQWLNFHDLLEEHPEIELPHSSNYSIMGEDTLWNAVDDHQRLAWCFLRQALKTLDPQTLSEESEEKE